MSTDIAVRTTLDLTRAPDEQWNEEMVAMVGRQLFRGTEVTKGQLYYCLTVAEGLRLNPMIGEIYFIPARSKNGQGPALLPYVGRNGLVKKAAERNYYYESDTVHEHDKFRITRKRDGTIEVTHSYGGGERGPIVGAYAFLHHRGGQERPAFFYAKLEEYLPTFDADWKMSASPWGNQRSAMIEKCAMIGAGRKRLELGNVLADGEIERVAQQQALTAPPVEEVPAQYDWQGLADAVGPDVALRLQEAVDRVHEYAPTAWPPAKLDMVVTGMNAVQVLEVVEQIEAEVRRHESRSAPAVGEGEQPPAEGSGGPGAAGSADEGVVDGEVVPDEAVGLALPVEEGPEGKVAALNRRAGELEDRLAELGSDDERERAELMAELDAVERELAAAEDPGQGTLGI